MAFDVSKQRSRKRPTFQFTSYLYNLNAIFRPHSSRESVCIEIFDYETLDPLKMSLFLDVCVFRKNVLYLS